MMIFTKLPKKPKESLISGESNILVQIEANEKDQFVLDCLGLFLQTRMSWVCIYSIYTHEPLFA